MKMLKAGLLLAALATLAPTSVAAKDYVVQMRNKGTDGAMVFEPAYVAASVGDRVRFVPTDPGHNAEPIAGMWAEATAPAAGKFNQEYIVTLTKPGIYGIRCLPHFGMGMVALIKAGKGKPSNMAAATAVKLPPFAAKRMAPMLAKAQ